MKSRLYSPSVVPVPLERLRSRIETRARFGALPGGGVTRPCWSPPHEEARAWLLGELRGAGLEAWVDPAGNVFGGTGARGVRPAAPVARPRPRLRNPPAGSDEAARYGSLFGSRAFCGTLDPALIPTLAAADGERLVDAMARAGFDA